MIWNGFEPVIPEEVARILSARSTTTCLLHLGYKSGQGRILQLDHCYGVGLFDRRGGHSPTPPPQAVL